MSLDPVTAGLGLLDTFIGKFVSDKDLAAKLMAESRTQEMAGEINARLGQIETNKVEAAHRSVWVAGWRPFCGWVCGASLAYAFVAYPVILLWYPDAPRIEMDELMTVLLGMLGMGGLRTWEKSKGVAR